MADFDDDAAPPIALALASPSTEGPAAGAGALGTESAAPATTQSLAPVAAPPVRYRPAWLHEHVGATEQKRKELKFKLRDEVDGSMKDTFKHVIETSTEILHDKGILDNSRYALIWLYLENEERLNYEADLGLIKRKKGDNDVKALKDADVLAAMAWANRRALALINVPAVDGAMRTEIVVTDKTGAKRYLVPLYDIVNAVLVAHTDCGHGGRKGTYSRASRKYVGITERVCAIAKKHCAECELTEASKRDKKLEEAQKQSLPVCNVWHRVQADLIDMRRTESVDPNTGKICRWILHIRDHGTRFSILLPLPKKTAKMVARELVKVFQLFGGPDVLHTDNGKEFRGKKVVKEMERIWPEIKLIYGKPRTPRTQGMVERANKEVKTILKKLLHQKKLPLSHWTTLLGAVQFIINTRKHSVLKATPFNLFFGRRSVVTLLDGLSEGLILMEDELTQEQKQHMGLDNDGDDGEEDDDQEDDDSEHDIMDDDPFAGSDDEDMESGDEQLDVTTNQAAEAAEAPPGRGTKRPRESPAASTRRQRQRR